MRMLRSYLILSFLLLSNYVSVHSQWVRTKGPYVERGVFSFTVSGTNLFVGTDRGVYVSTDYGTSWTATGFSNSSVTSLAVTPDGTGGTNLFAGTSYDLFLSTDGGATWNSTGLGAGVSSLAALGSNLYVGVWYYGVFGRFANNGFWTKTSTGLVNGDVYALTASGPNLYAATGGGVFVSGNGGTSWTDIGAGVIPDAGSLVVSGEYLFAGRQSRGVFRSSNNGTSWTEVSSGKFSGVTSFAVSPNGTGGTNLFAGTSSGVFLSTDNGTSWSAVNAGLTNSRVRALEVLGSSLFAGTSTVVRGTKDAG